MTILIGETITLLQSERIYTIIKENLQYNQKYKYYKQENKLWLL